MLKNLVIITLVAVLFVSVLLNVYLASEKRSAGIYLTVSNGSSVIINNNVAASDSTTQLQSIQSSLDLLNKVLLGH